MKRYYLVAIGGGIGSLVRFGITQFMAPMAVWAPLSILIINASGCFIISFLNFVSDPSGNIYLGPRSRLFLLVGFCGGYTTFSSFSLISFNAVRQGILWDLWLNIVYPSFSVYSVSGWEPSLRRLFPGCFGASYVCFAASPQNHMKGGGHELIAG